MSAQPPLTACPAMVVDGLPAVRDYARHVLQGQGFDPTLVRCCANPETALAMAADGPPQLLICDTFVGQATDWRKLVEQIRALSPQCELAILSFQVSTELQAQAQLAQARFVLKKPFAANDLKQAVASMVGAWMADRPDLFRLLHRPGQPAPPPAPRPPPAIALPPMPQIKPGDKVRYKDKTEEVAAVVIRQGELILHLKSKGEMVPASKVQRA